MNVTLDYYNIEIEDAIIEVTAQNILDNCVDGAGGPDTNFCSQIDRDPTTRDVSLVRSGFLNASALNTEGVEMLIDYSGISMEDLSLDGELDIKVIVSKLLELERFEFQNRPDEINVEHGEVGDPELQYRFSATYRTDNLSVNWTTRYLDRVANFDVSPTGDTPEDQSPAFVASSTTHDLSAAYVINDMFSVSGGIRNLFDELPPGFVKNGLYDQVGRRAFLNLKASF
jgi:hypothetical protein